MMNTTHKHVPWNKGLSKYDTTESGHKRKILVALPPIMKTELLEMSNESGRTMSDLIREALTDFRQKYLEKSERRARNKRLSQLRDQRLAERFPALVSPQ